MTPTLLELEGTWEEIAAHAPDFVGRRLRVTVLPLVQSQEDPRLRVLQEIEVRSQTMNPKPDERDCLREGRAGAMLGCLAPHPPPPNIA